MSMSTSNPGLDDDDEDLSNADRGDDLPDDEKNKDVDADKDKNVDADKDKDKDADADADKDKDKDKDADAGKDDDADADDEDDEDDEEKDDDGKPVDKNNFPIRLNKANKKAADALKKADQLERELAELRAQQNGGKKTDNDDVKDPVAVLDAELDGLYKKVEELRADANTAEAAKVQREIDKKNREIINLQTERTVARQTVRMTEAQRFDAMLDKVEVAVPQLDPKHEDYDAEAVKELEFQVVAYEKMGMAPTAALAKAVKLLHQFDIHGKPVAKEEKKDDKKTDKKDDKKDDKKAEKKTDLEKALDTAKRQPPDASDRGVNRDVTKINVEQLTDEEWDKLPESKKAEYRGDYA